MYMSVSSGGGIFNIINRHGLSGPTATIPGRNDDNPHACWHATDHRRWFFVLQTTVIVRNIRTKPLDPIRAPHMKSIQSQ